MTCQFQLFINNSTSGLYQINMRAQIHQWSWESLILKLLYEPRQNATNIISWSLRTSLITIFCTMPTSILVFSPSILPYTFSSLPLGPFLLAALDHKAKEKLNIASTSTNWYSCINPHFSSITKTIHLYHFSLDKSNSKSVLNSALGN